MLWFLSTPSPKRIVMLIRISMLHDQGIALLRILLFYPFKLNVSSRHILTAAFTLTCKSK